MKKRRKKTQFQRDRDKLDYWFSRYVRLRDADKNGICTCCTCGRQYHWKKMDAGHYIGRQWLSLRWHELNVHAQCKKCNCWGHGEQVKMRQYIQNKYGPKRLDDLESIPRTTLRKDLDLPGRIDSVRKKVEALLQEKNMK